MKIALFGGSFNPIHNGHLNIINTLIGKGLVDEVWIIPCGNHAFGKNLAKKEHRLNMIKIAIRGNKKVKISNMELDSDKESHTSETMQKLTKQFPHDFYFVIGSDNLKRIREWHDFEYLKNNVNFILLKRPGYEITPAPIKIAFILDIKGENSSTKVKKRLQEGLSINHLVPEKVFKYIKHRGLYANEV